MHHIVATRPEELRPGIRAKRLGASEKSEPCKGTRHNRSRYVTRHGIP